MFSLSTFTCMLLQASSYTMYVDFCAKFGRNNVMSMSHLCSHFYWLAFLQLSRVARRINRTIHSTA